MELESCVYMKNMMLFLQKAVHRVGEALPLPEGAGRASDVHGSEGQQRPEHVAVIQVETLGRKLYYIINYYQHDFLFNHFILIRTKQSELSVKKKPDVVDTVTRRSLDSVAHDSSSSVRILTAPPPPYKPNNKMFYLCTLI